jgi:hypothetical protein
MVSSANVNGEETGEWGGGVFKSTDSGTTWTAMNQGLPEGWVYTIAIDPTNPTTLYAGTHSKGVYKSLDGGASWQSKSKGLRSLLSWDAHNLEIRSLAVNPQNPEDLIVGVWGGEGVFETHTGGESWQFAGWRTPLVKVRVAYSPISLNSSPMPEWRRAVSCSIRTMKWTSGGCHFRIRPRGGGTISRL